jgi:hypothetical protein
MVVVTVFVTRKNRLKWMGRTGCIVDSVRIRFLFFRWLSLEPVKKDINE